MAHVPLVKALRYLANPCCLRSGMRMEVFRLCPTFHAVPPFSCLAEKRLADLHVPPSREPPLARGYPLSPASPGLPLSRLPSSAGRRCTRLSYLLCKQGAPVRASPRCSASGCWCRHLSPRSAPVGAAGTRCAPTSEAVAREIREKLENTK